MSKENQIKTGLIISVCATILIAVLGFGYNNASFPKQEKQINAIESDVKDLKNTINNDRLEKEGMKRDIKFTQQSINELKSDMKEGMKEIYLQLREINKNTK